LRVFQSTDRCTGIVIIVFSMQSGELAQQEARGEFFCFIAAATMGMVLMTGATNLLMMYMALEMVSIPSYVLAGFSKKHRRSGEAALKYVMFGGASSGVMLYGISLLFGLTGSLDISTIQSTLASGVVAHNAGGYVVLIISLS
jgi:NADH-quinone oxidoreductase subunit N